MSRSGLYDIVDIDGPEDFKYFENVADLLETDEYIDDGELRVLLAQVDKKDLLELLDSYFDEVQGMIPQDETDFFVTVDTIRRSVTGTITENAEGGDAGAMADAIQTFRKWYLRNDNVFDMSDGSELSVRDALFNLRAAKITGEDLKYDFRTALDYSADSYGVLVQDLVQEELASDDGEGTDMGYVPDNPYSGLSEDEITEILDQEEGR